MNIYPCNMDCGEFNIEQGQRGGMGGGSRRKGETTNKVALLNSSIKW